MKYLLLLLLINSLDVFGQSKVFKCFAERLSQAELKTRLNEIISRPDSNCYLPVYRLQIVRNLDFGYSQAVGEAELHMTDRKGWHRVTVYSVFAGDSIVLLHVEDKVNHAAKVIKWNEFLTLRYLSAFEKTYERKYTLQDFRDSFTTLKVYGFHCGNAGGSYHTRETVLLDSLVTIANQLAISNMLRSLNPEEQGFGYEGLLKLRAKGIMIDKGDRAIVDRLTRINSEVNYCSGCDFGGTTDFKSIKKFHRKQ